MVLHPDQTYIQLGADGAARALAGGPAFWAQPDSALDGIARDWLISEFTCEADWPSWEMHPNGDEFVYLLSGAATLLLEQAGEVREVALNGSGAVIVPRGVWHTAKVHSPSRMLHVTMGEGTQHRPA